MVKECECTVATVGLPSLFPDNAKFCTYCGKELKESKFLDEAKVHKSLEHARKM